MSGAIPPLHPFPPILSVFPDTSLADTAFEIWWHTRRNQISCFGETDESI